MGRRRQSREIALQALYIVDTSGMPCADALASVTRREDSGDRETLNFAYALIFGTVDKQAGLDALIQDTAKNWALTRMAAVDRNILRLAAYEILHTPDTPISVIIDEAIEIARKFSTEESTKFINGILDKIKEKRPPHGRIEGSL